MLASVPPVLLPLLTPCSPERRSAGEVLLRRGDVAPTVSYLESGRVIFGICGSPGNRDELMEHQLGQMQGPAWLDPTAAVLDLPAAMDAVAQTDVVLRQVPVAEFQAALAANRQLSATMLTGVARAHREQTELAVSRLAKGAEARCAEWLLQHAESNDKGVCAVQLQQRKRLIAAQLGIAPETLSRVLRHLRERSLISGSGRTVNLVDPHGLRSLAGV
ncbi:Crp/Fnr family transcriptional regulator [Rhodoferax bucti]|uniref:Crp/Fnr family transcriptional regulator n=1 Tax=Rhodoferax bucti TaxID=2576305 RepID=UPI00110813F0|nr:Crp/Fnr family transcriptional regulator [Rhodoferax bucti]